jgi:hypothetical protein
MTARYPIEDPEYPIVVQLEEEGSFHCGDCPGHPYAEPADPVQHYREVHGLADAAEWLLVVVPEDR